MDKKTKERIIEIVSEQLGIPIEEITPKADFLQDLNAEKIIIPDILLAIEEEFKIQIPKEEKEKIATVNDLIEAVFDQLP